MRFGLMKAESGQGHTSRPVKPAPAGTATESTEAPCKPLSAIQIMAMFDAYHADPTVQRQLSQIKHALPGFCVVL